MSASTAAVNPAPAPSTPAPTRAPASQTSTPNDHCFDHHLDAARQQQDAPREPAAGQSASEAVVAPAAVPAPLVVATTAAPAAAEALLHPAPATQHDEATDDPALAAAMLALIGQAVPAPPLAAANGLVHAATKAVHGAAGEAPAPAPSALALLPGATIAGQNAQATPGQDTDAQALAPLLGKAATWKDTPVDGTRAADTLAALTAHPGATAAVTPAHTLVVPSPAGTPAFAQELGEHIAWLGTQDVKQARVRLHPEDLGSMDIKVSVQHDRIDVSFAVQHPAAVHVVQQTLPQLDLLLAQHGLALGQADVGQRQHQGESGRGGDAVAAIGEVEAEPGIVASTPLASLGMLDTFA